MQILQLRKHDKYCHECGKSLIYRSVVSKADGKIRHLYCAKIRRLHGGVMWWIKRNFL